jgi:hypothetical protein
MGRAERTTFEYSLRSGSLQPNLVITVQVMEAADHEHFISSMLFSISPVFFIISPMFPAIATLAFAESAWTTVQREVGNYIGALRTLFVLNRHLPNLSYDHPDLLVYQTIQSLERILNICPSQQFPEIYF